MNKKDIDILTKFFTINEDLREELAKAESIEVFVSCLKEWVFHECSIFVDSRTASGYLSFTFGDKTRFIVNVPIIVAEVFQKYLDPKEKKNGEKTN